MHRCVRGLIILAVDLRLRPFLCLYGICGLWGALGAILGVSVALFVYYWDGV